MYSYKLNNSYTVYVSYAYLNSCIKASKGAKYPNRGHMGSASASGQSVCMKPLLANTLFHHNTFGNGRLLMTDDRGIMYIAFGDKTVRFKYPDAIYQGYLTTAGLNGGTPLRIQFSL